MPETPAFRTKFVYFLTSSWLLITLITIPHGLQGCGRTSCYFLGGEGGIFPLASLVCELVCLSPIVMPVNTKAKAQEGDIAAETAKRWFKDVLKNTIA